LLLALLLIPLAFAQNLYYDCSSGCENITFSIPKLSTLYINLSEVSQLRIMNEKWSGTYNCHIEYIKPANFSTLPDDKVNNVTVYATEFESYEIKFGNCDSQLDRYLWFDRDKLNAKDVLQKTIRFYGLVESTVGNEWVEIPTAFDDVQKGYLIDSPADFFHVTKYMLAGWSPSSLMSYYYNITLDYCNQNITISVFGDNYTIPVNINSTPIVYINNSGIYYFNASVDVPLTLYNNNQFDIYNNLNLSCENATIVYLNNSCNCVCNETYICGNTTVQETPSTVNVYVNNSDVAEALREINRQALTQPVDEHPEYLKLSIIIVGGLIVVLLIVLIVLSVRRKPAEEYPEISQQDIEELEEVPKEEEQEVKEEPIEEDDYFKKATVDDDTREKLKKILQEFKEEKEKKKGKK